MEPGGVKKLKEGTETRNKLLFHFSLHWMILHHIFFLASDKETAVKEKFAEINVKAPW